MTAATHDSDPSIKSSLIVGIGVGVAVLLLYVGGGLVLGGWNFDDFLANLTVEIVGSLLLASGVVVSIFALPIVLFLYHRLLSPLIVLGIVVFGWISYGFLTGILNSATVFGLGLYAFGLAPGYLLLYLVTGGAEYNLRK